MSNGDRICKHNRYVTQCMNCLTGQDGVDFSPLTPQSDFAAEFKAYFSRMGKKGSASQKAVVTTEQRQKWGRRGARKRWAVKRKADQEKSS